MRVRSLGAPVMSHRQFQPASRQINLRLCVDMRVMFYRLLAKESGSRATLY